MLLCQPAHEDQLLQYQYQHQHQHQQEYHHQYPSQSSSPRLLYQQYQPQPQPQTQQHQLRRPCYPQSLVIDLDLRRLGLDLNLNLASSPATTTSSPTATTAATTHASHLGFAGPSGSRRLPSPDDSPLSTSSCLSPPPELMPSNPWMLSAANYHPHQSQSKSVSRFQHNHDSSISSLGSTSPASPFAHNISTPQIAVTDSACDGLSDFRSGGDDGPSLYQIAKSLNPSQSQLYSGYANAYTCPVDHMGPSAAGMASYVAANLTSSQRQPRQQQQQQHHQLHVQGQGQAQNRGLLPAPEFSVGHPRPNAASVASGDSPATPSGGEPDDYDRRRSAAVYANPPKLDRTITDAYADELYSPDFAMTSPPPSSQSQPQVPSSASNDLFAQRLQDANSQRLGMPLSPVSTSRGHSPFRQDPNSFAAPSMHDYRALTGNHAQFPSLQSRGHIETEPLMAQHITQTETPATISPKEAMLDFHDRDSQHSLALFPSQDTIDFDASQLSKSVSPESPDQAGASYSQAFRGVMPTAIPEGIMVPQHYPFIPRQQPPTDTSVVGSGSCHSSSDHAASPQITPTTSLRPPSVDSEAGTYTCTYHGCSLRFESQIELQKHKREGHRQVHGPHSIRHKLDLKNIARFNSQAGPHRCDRINPSTNKPCHTIFSRPYDLTRHEDTIHNGRKRKTRCPLCTEEKTFSRRDALTRHYRVCHPDEVLRSRHRRRHLAVEAADGTTNS